MTIGAPLHNEELVDLLLSTGERLNGARMAPERRESVNDASPWIVDDRDGVRRYIAPEYIVMLTIRERPHRQSASE